MKKLLFYLLSFTAIILIFSECKKDEDLNAWKESNTNAYNAITKNPDYRALKTSTGPTGVYYKVLKSGTGTEYPIQTSKVNVLYKFSFYNGVVFDPGTGENGIPFLLEVSGSLYGAVLPRGLSFALQNMVVGDKWEIWVPHFLGYGMYGLQDSYYNTIIKGYTTLVYEIELVSIKQYP